jgi:hypothetical protein
VQRIDRAARGMLDQLFQELKGLLATSSILTLRTSSSLR